jgi:predicted carbohydrate-binding protein with CBM5 and CBM33 domain
MKMSTLRATGLGVLVLLASAVFGHGLIQDPPSRAWICGFITKPDHVQNGVAQFPVCGDAFFAPGTNQTDGYSFMSVLTHTTGRLGVGPRENVCSFNSESFPGRTIPWDVPINWPTQPMTAGPRNFVWSISWGPHFSDTSDFRYWITKSDFVWQQGRALSFSDFEEAPFCNLDYNDANPGANPNVTRDTANALFTTRCTVPSRTGRHVIYGEWGRTPPTFERFHSCVDVQFSGNQPPVITANIAMTPNVTTFTGTGQIALNGSGSTGSNLSYNWSVSAPNAGIYTITNPTSANATLNINNAPAAAQDVTVTLLITSGNSSDTETRTFLHQPAANTTWQDLGALTADPRTLVVGDRVTVRTVSGTGTDAFCPTTPITITSANTGSTQWPVTLGNACNAQNGAVRVGVLNTANNTVTPAANATSNRVFAQTSANIQSAFLQVQTGAVPNAPAGLTQTAGNAQCSLSWTATSGATGYNVKRSNTSGGPYANVGANVTGTSFVNTGLTNGTTYYYVVTALNASGESTLSNQVSCTPSGGGTPGGATATGAVAASSPWFNELQVRLGNTQTITAMTVTVTVARTAGTAFSGQYNTVGGQITQASSSTSSTITYTWTLNSGQQLGAATSRTFAAQFGGNGTAHPVTGDRWTVTYTPSGGTSQTLQGSF